MLKTHASGHRLSQGSQATSPSPRASPGKRAPKPFPWRQRPEVLRGPRWPAAHPSCALMSVKQAAEPKTPPAPEEGKQEANLHAGSGLGVGGSLASQPSRTGRQEVPGQSGGREEFVERMDCCVDSGEGHRAMHRQTARETAPHKFQGNPLQEGRLGPSSAPPQTWPGAAQASTLTCVTPSTLCTRGHPNRAGSRAPDSTSPSPPRKWPSAIMQKAALSSVTATDVCGGVLRKALLLPNCS